jgi:hypothetical protein
LPKTREIITPYDLVERFGYTYSYACKKLSLLKRQSLVMDLGNTPSTYRGQWCLTDKGYRRLYYLSRKLGVPTERKRREWREWYQEEARKPFEEQRVWWIDGVGARMIKEGERSVTLAEAKQMAR